MRPVFLIGFMACGKTTLGRALAAACPDLRFVDLDDAIVRSAGMPVSEIFAARGEAGFRQLEAGVLRAVACDDTVVACGGGTPCRKENMDFMLAAGTVVRLTASPAKTVARLVNAGPGRPLVDACLGDRDALLDKVRSLMAAREDAYAQAPLTFDAEHMDNLEELACCVARFRDEIIGRVNG